MAQSFTGRNFCAAILATVVVALMIAAAVGSWYARSVEYNSTPTTTSSSGNLPAASSSTLLNSTKVWYDLNGFKQESRVMGTVTSVYNNYGATSGSTLRNIVKTSQAFVLIALLSGVILLTLLVAFFSSRIRNKVIFAFGMTVTRLLLVIFCGIILISVIIAFLVFIGVTLGFKNESEICVEGPCRKFVDSTTVTTVSGSNTIDEVRSWGPREGWYITLASIPVSVTLLILVLVNKFPLPIDSEASSGEAL
jgi:hypothetical protein